MICVQGEKRSNGLEIAILSVYTLLIVFAIYFKATEPQVLRLNYFTQSYFTPEERLLMHGNPFSFFKTVDFSDGFNWSWLAETVLNVLVFVPFGVMVSYFFKRLPILKAFLISLAFSVAVEVAQFFTLLGGFEAMDVITNTLGGLIGGIIYYLCFRKIPSSSKAFKGGKIAFLSLSSCVLFALTLNVVIHIDVYADILLRRI